MCIRDSYAEAHYNLGCLLQKAPGRLDDAIAQYAEALRVKPGLPEAHYNLGRALEAKPGRLNEAIAHYEEALRLKPDYAEAHNSLGDALQESPGRMPEAIRQYEEAVRLKPGFARAHFNLGYALETAGGRKDEAVAHYCLLYTSRSSSPRPTRTTFRSTPGSACLRRTATTRSRSPWRAARRWCARSPRIPAIWRRCLLYTSRCV